MQTATQSSVAAGHSKYKLKLVKDGSVCVCVRAFLFSPPCFDPSLFLDVFLFPLLLQHSLLEQIHANEAIMLITNADLIKE